MMSKNIKKWTVEMKDAPGQPVKIKGPFPLTDLQQAYFIGRQSNIALGNCATHLYTELECPSYLEDNFLETLHLIFKKHDIFRTSFTEDGSQCVFNEIKEFKIPHYDISQLDEQEKRKFLLTKREKMKKTILDYKKAPLAEFEITILSKRCAIIHFYLDGLITDGRSYEAFMSELDSIYTDKAIGEKRLDVSFYDFVLYQIQERETKAYEESKQYWMDKIPRLPDIPELPLKTDTACVDAAKNSKVSRAMAKSKWKCFEENAKEAAVSTFILMFTAFAKTIARYSKNQSFLLNVPLSMRPPIWEDINNLIGECSNFILFDFTNLPNETFIETARRIQEQFWELMDNCSFSGTEVVRELSKKSGVMGSGIVPVVFTSTLGASGYKEKNFFKRFVETRTSQVWIDAIVFDFPDEILFSWDYLTELFEPQTLQNMIDTFYHLLELFAKDPRTWDEKNSLELADADRKTVEKYQSKTVHREQISLIKMLESAILRYGAKKAIYSDEILTYNQLKTAIDHVVHVIQMNVIPAQSNIAVIMGKSWKQMAVVLGVLAAGCVYVPIDLSYPKKQMEHCMTSCEIALVFKDDYYNSSEQMDSNRIIIDAESLGYFDKIVDVSWVYHREPVVCIIHTSGSTGMPKGIKINEKGLRNSLIYTIERFDISNRDKSIALTNLCHDMSMFDFMGLLICGGAVVIPDEIYAKEPNEWMRLILKYDVTIWNSVPALMELLLETVDEKQIKAMRFLRLIIQGGAAMKYSYAEKILSCFPDAKLMNLGGPAETTLWNIMHEVTKEDIKNHCIPYGIPISNTRYYILNDNKEQCPPGTQGAMYIAGDGVSDGYVQNEDETNKRFVFGLMNEKIMFYSGDLGTVLQNGEIFFVGRDDAQVKINGKRIEMNGIENMISQVPGIKNVVVKLSSNEKYLQAYYVAESLLAENDIIHYLEQFLPRFMIPSLYKRIDIIPLKSTGKPNRELLKDITIASNIQKEDFDTVSYQILHICEEELNIPHISLEDNFFTLGGNSVQAIKILIKLKETFRIDISLNDILLSPYMNDWYALIKEKLNERVFPDKQTESFYSGEMRKLSMAQESIWTSQLLGNKDGNVLVSYFYIKGELNVDLFTESVKKAMDKHVVLRESVVDSDDGFRIRIVKKINFQKNDELIDEARIKEMILEKQGIEFDFEQVLHDIELYCVRMNGEMVHCLVITLHHIVADEETFNILYNDIISNYTNDTPGVIHGDDSDLDYFDYIEKQQKSYKLKIYMDYWKHKLENIHYTNPFQCSQGMGRESNSCAYENFIEQEELLDLQNKCAALDATLYMGLITMFGLALLEHSEENSIYIGAPISNRFISSHNESCGLYTNMSLIVVREEEQVSHVIKAVKHDVLQTMKYSIVPYETIVRQNGIRREYLHVPFHININYLGSRRKSIKRKAVEFGTLEYSKGNSSHNLGLLIENIDGRFACSLTYRKNYISCKQIVMLKSSLSHFIKRL